MEKIIILGIGNQLMMDDGIGIYLAKELSKRDDSPNNHYLIGESDIDYCLDQIEGVAFILILDAVLSGKKPGELSIYSLADLHEYQILDLSPHNLHLFQVLYQQKETLKGFLIGVEPYEMRFHIGLSDTLKQKWSLILRDVAKVIDELIAKQLGK
jgi:hydrogenase maturation protease